MELRLRLMPTSIPSSIETEYSLTEQACALKSPIPSEILIADMAIPILKPNYIVHRRLDTSHSIF